MSFERFKMRDGRVLVIDTMEGQIQLDAFRDFLGSGLQIQLEVRPHTVGYLETYLNLRQQIMKRVSMPYHRQSKALWCLDSSFNPARFKG